MIVVCGVDFTGGEGSSRSVGFVCMGDVTGGVVSITESEELHELSSLVVSSMTIETLP